MMKYAAFTLKHHFKSTRFSVFVQMLLQDHFYTLINILVEVNCLFLRFLLSFYFQRAVFKFSAHCERISTALQIKLQCAVKKKTVRWKFENLVVFSKNSSPEINKCKRTALK